MSERDHYTYRVSWSQEDGEYVATCAEFPSLSWLDEDDVEALKGIKRLVRDTITDMRETGEPVPVPLADKDYSGTLSLRLPPDLHRRLAIMAAEARISLNRFISHKLATVAG